MAKIICSSDLSSEDLIIREIKLRVYYVKYEYVDCVLKVFRSLNRGSEG